MKKERGKNEEIRGDRRREEEEREEGRRQGK